MFLLVLLLENHVKQCIWKKAFYAVCCYNTELLIFYVFEDLQQNKFMWVES